MIRNASLAGRCSVRCRHRTSFRRWRAGVEASHGQSLDDQLESLPNADRIEDTDSMRRSTRIMSCSLARMQLLSVFLIGKCLASALLALDWRSNSSSLLEEFLLYSKFKDALHPLTPTSIMSILNARVI